MAEQGSDSDFSTRELLRARRQQFRVGWAFLAGDSIAALAEREHLTPESIEELILLACRNALTFPAPVLAPPGDGSLESIRRRRRFWRDRLEILRAHWHLRDERVPSKKRPAPGSSRRGPRWAVSKWNLGHSWRRRF